ncbi:hypothetical protein GOP47_0020997 [Adiantum capillus-veneris]|uniref:Peroxidase n=1 Tax=Adiantum capillus-veneris TaxID=13818 RepID=A0A9D4Z889_ADICA|nr:hypothetical protein GOP47_0020997 [Adiantum capillus-veneris]
MASSILPPLQLPLAFLSLILIAPAVMAQLSNDYYAATCPNVESLVRSSLRSTFTTDITAPAAMIRLLFHDCQVDGCDASILLVEGGSGNSIEMKSPLNLGVRKLNLIDRLKAQLESECPQTVSCADIIALAARDAVALSGGPDISIPLGRLDGFSASSSAATSALPKATVSVSDAISLFGAMQMNLEESVSMLGSHTVGVAHCTNFKNRLYPRMDRDLGLLFGATLQTRCPRLSPIDLVATLDTSFLRFDNSYFQNVLNRRALLTIDSEIAHDPRTGPIVQNFAQDEDAFFNAFASGFVKLANFNVLSGSQGEVRVDCRSVNG